VVLENKGEDKLDRSCEKRSITKSQGGKEHPAGKISNVCINVALRRVLAIIVAVLKQ
jgi:hypothetical protein